MFGEQLASTFVNGAMNLLGSGAQYGWNTALTKLQNEYNLDMWRMQNEYNSPSAQMERLKQAGLNPNLAYGNVSTGNSTSPPVKSAPEAPDIQRAMENIGKLFNVEQLRTAVANRREAMANAQIKEVEAADAKDRRAAMRDFGNMYSFDRKTGQYVFTAPDLSVERPMSKSERKLTDFTGSPSNRIFFFNQALADDYTRRALIPYRQKLMGSQANYLQPQIEMANYDRRFYPVSYWIGQGTNVMRALPLPKFSFNKSFERKENHYFNHY